VPQSLARFLQAFDGQADTAAIVREFLHDPQANGWAPGKLESFVRGYVSKGILVDADTPAALPACAPNRADYMSLKVPLLRAGAVARLSEPLKWLYRPSVVRSAVFAILVLTGIFFFAVLPPMHFDVNRVKGFDFLAVVALLSAVALFHEIGHATALASCGNRPGQIGWGIYLFFPVFYTDLSNAWRLTRKQRVLVDLGGIYFEGLVLSALIAARLGGARSPFLLYLSLGVALQLASNLNPFLRRDGYWVTADLTGIPDLQGRSLRALLTLNRGVDGHASPPFPLAVKAYVAFALGYFLLVYQFFIRQLIGSVLPRYPETLRDAIRSWTESPPNPVHIADATISAIWKGLAVLGLILLVFRLLRRSIEIANRRRACS
jgi:putative peptide zinc metalloprotease protein